MNHLDRTIVLCLVATSFSVKPGLAQQSGFLADLLTRAEQTDYRETSRYADVVRFVDRVAESSSRIHRTRFGYSLEGRELPLLVVGDVADPSPEAVRASGKTRVFIQGNIHAGEVCGKEALQMLLREIAQGQHRHWLDSVVLLIAPIYNADGNEMVSLTNRPRQHGPTAGMGQRPNAQGYDLNRDHMKLDSPEAKSLVRLLSEYDPHVGVDLHTTNGSRHAYHITYSPPLHPNTPEVIDAMLRDRWLPAAGRYLQDATGWLAYYYGNAGRDPSTGADFWRTFDHRPRFNNNYLGLRNRFAILSEAYSYATFEERVLATLSFTKGVVEFAHRNATEIRRATAAADAIDLTGVELAVRAEATQTASVEILMGEVVEERNPYSGAIMLRRLDVVNPEQRVDMGTFAATETARVPAAYLIPPGNEAVIEKLTLHGVALERLASPREFAVEQFALDSTTVASREFQQHRERQVFGAYREIHHTLPEGTTVVRTNQPLGRLIFYLLEPRSDDGLLNWNVLDGTLERADTYPVLRTFERF